MTGIVQVINRGKTITETRKNKPDVCQANTKSSLESSGKLTMPHAMQRQDENIWTTKRIRN